MIAEKLKKNKISLIAVIAVIGFAVMLYVFMNPNTSEDTMVSPDKLVEFDGTNESGLGVQRLQDGVMGGGGLDLEQPIGMGAAVAEVLAEAGTGTRLLRLGVRDAFAEGASLPYLFRKHGLDEQGITHSVVGALNLKETA